MRETEGLPRRLSAEESACSAGDSGLVPGREDPWRRKWQPTPVFLAGESHGQNRLVGDSPWGHSESDTTEHTQAHENQRRQE